MQALFIGQTYIDVTFITDHMPTGDEKHVASAYAVSFGGNAVTAAFCCAKLGIVPDLIATVANDWLGRMFQDMSAKYGISIHPRKVNSSSLSFIMPKDGKRAIVRCRDDEHIHPFPLLNLGNCRALHIDGHQPDAAMHYARLCREAGILTSLDGGGLRTNTHELLEFIDVAIVAERLCEQMDLTSQQMLDYLKSRGCRVGGVTMGEQGLLWYDETGAVHSLPALPIARERVSTPTAPAMSFTAPTSIPISPIPAKAGTLISSSRVPPRPSRSSGSATRRDCRRLPISRRSGRSSKSGSDGASKGSLHGSGHRRRQHQHGCGGDGRAASPRRRDRRGPVGRFLSRGQRRQPGGRGGQARRGNRPWSAGSGKTRSAGNCGPSSPRRAST